jgi:hypothetical protein
MIAIARFLASRWWLRHRTAAPPGRVTDSFSSRVKTRTPSHSSELSLGACISASHTVLSIRTTVPRSILSRLASVSKVRLIRSQVSARIRLIVFCNTDFFGHSDNGNRAKARNEAESSR